MPHVHIKKPLYDTKTKQLEQTKKRKYENEKYQPLDLSSISTCFGYRWSTCWYFRLSGSFVKGGTFTRSGTSTPPSPTANARCEFWLIRKVEWKSKPCSIPLNPNYPARATLFKNKKKKQKIIESSLKAETASVPPFQYPFPPFLACVAVTKNVVPSSSSLYQLLPDQQTSAPSPSSCTLCIAVCCYSYRI